MVQDPAVGRIECHGRIGIGGSFCDIPVGEERPCECIGRTNARRSLVCATGEIDGTPCVAVIGKVAGQLDIGSDAVRLEQRLDRLHQRVLLSGLVEAAGCLIRLAERDHELGERDSCRRRFIQLDGLVQATLRGADAGHAGGRVDVPGNRARDVR